MRTLLFTLATAAVMVGTSAGAQAGNCIRMAALGDAITKDLAVVMSTHGLINIMDNKGRTGKGPVHTTCKAGFLGTECTSSQLACK